MISGLRIPDQAFPYLLNQRGALSDMQADRSRWESLYVDTIFAEFEMMRPFLPKTCDAILDIGSGLGGIDALLNSHYGGDCRITLVDGVADSSEVELHRKTFNNMSVARDFLKANEVPLHHISHIDANDPKRCVSMKYDLVISLKSWCFHVEPNEHIQLAVDASELGHTVLIVDLRRGKDDWRAQLARYFDFQMIQSGPKAITTAMWLK